MSVVRPQTVRLFLVDVHKRAHQQLLDRKAPKATTAEIAASQARVTAAEKRGHYIDVKRELNIREARQVQKRMLPGGVIRPGETIGYDAAEVGFAQVAMYLLGWNLCDPEGHPLSCDEDTIGNLDVQTFNEIYAAIDAHVDAVTAEKNGMGEAPKSEATSPSVAP